MQLRKLLSFITEAVTAGLAFAFVLVLLFRPEAFDSRPTIEFTEAPVEEQSDEAGSRPLSYANAVEKAAPAVVNIFTRKTVTQSRHPLLEDPFLQRFFGDALPAPQKRTETSLGSGVIVNSDGYILTNNHVIQAADEIEVALHDGRNISATIVGTDPETDLAVLRISLTNLPHIVLGHSDTVRVGDIVLAIGNPFGVGQTVTSGIVSAKGRSELGLSTFENFIQTDAAINPGNSGGALINTQGNLVGINTAIFSRSGGSQGIGFAIPTDLVKGVMQQILEHGHALRGWLGVEVQDLNPELVESFNLKNSEGALIAGLHNQGPGAKADLQPGDIITRVNDQPVTNSRSLMNIVASNPPGSRLKLDLLRNGKAQTIEAEIGERPQPQDQ